MRSPRPPSIPTHLVDATHDLLERGAVWVSPRLPGVAFARDLRGRTYLVRATTSGVTCTCDVVGDACGHRYAAMALWAEHAEDEADEFDRQRAVGAELDAELETALTDDTAASTNGRVDRASLNGNGYHEGALVEDGR